MQQIFSKSSRVTVNRGHENCRIDLRDAHAADYAESSDRVPMVGKDRDNMNSDKNETKEEEEER